jgi:nucleoside-diphosphate-sugar epimerase
MSETGNRTPAFGRIIIFGASGFISKAFQKKLKKYGLIFKAISSGELDLANAQCTEKLSEFIEPTDTLVFLSANLPAGGQTISSLMGNLTMAENMARVLSEKRVNHFVYLSSEAVYDAERIPMDEDSSREPVSLYALMHTAREMMLDEICSKQNIPLIRLRPSYVYGPGHTHNNYGPNSFIRSALQNQEIKLYGKGEERRNFLFIEDLAEILVEVVKEKKEGVLNVVTDRSLSYLEVARCIIKKCPKPIRITFEPRKIKTVHRPYKITQLFRFIYNLGRPISPVVHRTYANRAIRNAFPKFKFTPLEKGIEKAMAFIEDPPSVKK